MYSVDDYMALRSHFRAQPKWQACVQSRQQKPAAAALPAAATGAAAAAISAQPQAAQPQAAAAVGNAPGSVPDQGEASIEIVVISDDEHPSSKDPDESDEEIEGFWVPKAGPKQQVKAVQACRDGFPADADFFYQLTVSCWSQRHKQPGAAERFDPLDFLVARKISGAPDKLFSLIKGSLQTGSVDSFRHPDRRGLQRGGAVVGVASGTGGVSEEAADASAQKLVRQVAVDLRKRLMYNQHEWRAPVG
jgi:hypothetical protein